MKSHMFHRSEAINADFNRDNNTRDGKVIKTTWLVSLSGAEAAVLAISDRLLQVIT